jgi:GntR family transcriptional repressor for pyruvate dehydrogenase complex
MTKKNAQEIPSSAVLEHLQRLIVRRDMQPGDRLPSERMLATELRVGRPSVREAIKALQTLDVLDSRHGDGTFIKSRVGMSGGWPSRVKLSERDFDLIELLEVRKIFEPIAAALAAARRSEKQLALMERELIAQEKDPDNREILMRHDYLFHEEVIHAAGNRVLQDIVRLLSPLLVKSRKQTSQSTPDTRKVIQQHRTIFEAIRLRDPDLAEQAMRSHLQTTGLDLISYASSKAARPSLRRQNKSRSMVDDPLAH